MRLAERRLGEGTLLLPGSSDRCDPGESQVHRACSDTGNPSGTGTSAEQIPDRSTDDGVFDGFVAHFERVWAVAEPIPAP